MHVDPSINKMIYSISFFAFGIIWCHALVTQRRLVTRATLFLQAEQRSSSVTQASSASILSGAGPIQVDMNQYNIPFDRILEEWTASIVPPSPLQEEGIYLGAKSTKEILVDTIKIAFPRESEKSLGLELLEISGGREDGVGITVVAGLVEGGCASESAILPGDAIVKVAVHKQSIGRINDQMFESQEEVAVNTECLDWDRTVEAIRSLPPCEDDNELFVLTIKRLRRKPKVTMNLQYPPDMNEPDTKIELFSGENLRRAMLVRGVKLNDALARRFDSGGSGDCGAEGACATCVVSIVQGGDLLNPPGTQEAQMLRDNPRWRLSCKTIVGYGMKEGELTVRVNPRQW